MESILVVVAVVAMLAGAIFYNPLRRKMAGIIGVGGAYLILIGVMIACMGVATMIRGSSGNASDMGIAIVFMVLTLGYMIYVMLTRCKGVKQRILLPFAACLIGLGFAWRLLAAIVLHIPMESGKNVQETVFPKTIKSPDGEEFTLENDSGDNATYYCSRTGQRVQFRDADFRDGYYPAGWR